MIAPGQGGTGNMATDLMEQMKPHAHDPSEDDRKSAAFKGSARTLDGLPHLTHLYPVKSTLPNAAGSQKST